MQDTCIIFHQKYVMIHPGTLIPDPSCTACLMHVIGVYMQYAYQTLNINTSDYLVVVKYGMDLGLALNVFYSSEHVFHRMRFLSATGMDMVIHVPSHRF
jgi:hypothetical protein